MGRPIMTVRWPTGPLTLTGRGATGRQAPTGLGAMDRRHRRLIAPAIASIQVPRRRSAGDQERRPAPVRSATAKTGPAAVTPVKQDPNAKFKAVQAKAKRVGVEQLTQKDIEGLSFEQIKQLRGY